MILIPYFVELNIYMYIPVVTDVSVSRCEHVLLIQVYVLIRGPGEFMSYLRFQFIKIIHTDI